jgi:hypothetical protein
MEVDDLGCRRWLEALGRASSEEGGEDSGTNSSFRFLTAGLALVFVEEDGTGGRW